MRICCWLASLIVAVPMAVHAFDSFKTESAEIVSELSCHEQKMHEARSLWGAMFACLGGTHRTMKVFVNEVPGEGRVKDVKIMWNDYTVDVGEGVHADAAIARAWVATLATRYAPYQVAEVVDAFFGHRDAVFTSKGYRFEYSYHAGPAIDEYLIQVTDN